MNKKGVLSIFLAVMTTFIIIYAFIVLGNTGKINDRIVGMDAIKLGELYQIGEDARSYIDNAAHYSKGPALYLFEKNGLFPECGEMETYFLWKNKTHECYPDENSISFGIRSAFASIINPYLENYLLYDITLDYVTPADLKFKDSAIMGYPFDSLVVNNDPFYSVSQGFSVDYDYPFDYGEIQNHVMQINDQCKDKEGMALKNCVDSEINKVNIFESRRSREWIFGGCGSTDEAMLNAFAEKYNDCASSHDYKCDCPSAAYDPRINIQGQVAVLGNESSLLGLPFNAGAMLPGARLVKQKNFIDLAVSGAVNPICRSDRRMFRVCVKQPFRVRIGNERKQLMTRFAFYVDDGFAPEPVVVSERNDKKAFEWLPSGSADVEEYRVFVYKKGLVPDYSTYDIVLRETNSDEKLSFMKDTTIYDIEVVAVDFDGNCMISGKKQKCK
ncbi:MAG: hypothetical protein KAT43_01920 [Nanoarchaeota archaeon]|nr:hypothetical protein [Nanoarchaeota archaeon]